MNCLAKKNFLACKIVALLTQILKGLVIQALIY